MKKQTLLFSLFALLAGILLGGTGKFLLQETEAGDRSKNTAEAKSASRPRFGDFLSRLSLVLKRKSISDQTNEPTLNVDFKRYSRMECDELWNEMEKLNRQYHYHYENQCIATNMRLAYIYKRLGQKFPNQALKKLKESSGDHSVAESYIMESWMDQNPESAMAYYQQKREETAKSDVALDNRYLVYLATSSPAKAVSYLNTLPAGYTSIHLQTMLNVVCKKTPEKMEEVIRELAPEIRKINSVDSDIAAAWAKADWNAAVQWINSLPEEKRDQAMGVAVGCLSPEEAAQKLSTLTAPARQDAINKVVSQTLHTPVVALDWLQKNVTEEEAVKVFNEIYHPDNFYNPQFTAYIDKMPAGALRDTLLEKTIPNPYNDNPDRDFLDKGTASIFDITNKISSPEKRAQVLDKTMHTWILSAPEDIKSWLTTSNIPAEKKAEYLKACERFIKLKDTKG